MGQEYRGDDALVEKPARPHPQAGIEPAATMVDRQQQATPRGASLAQRATMALSVLLVVSALAAATSLVELDNIHDHAAEAIERVLPTAQDRHRKAVDAASLFAAYHELLHGHDQNGHQHTNAGDPDHRQHSILRQVVLRAGSLQQLLPAENAHVLDEVVSLSTRVVELTREEEQLRERLHLLVGRSEELSDRISMNVDAIVHDSTEALSVGLAAMEGALKREHTAQGLMREHGELSRQIQMQSGLRAIANEILKKVQGLHHTVMRAEHDAAVDKLRASAAQFERQLDELAPVLESLREHRDDHVAIEGLLALLNGYRGIGTLFRERERSIVLQQEKGETSRAVDRNLELVAQQLNSTAGEVSLQGIERILASSSWTKLVVAVGIGITALFFLATVLFGRRHVLLPLTQASAALDALQNGETEVELPPMRLHELESIRQSLVRFRASTLELARMNRRLEREVAERRLSEQAARHAERDTLDAIESIADGFVLFDRDHRLMLCNSRFREMYQPAADLLNPGIGFEELLRKTVARGCYADLGHREQAWIAARLQDFGKLRGLPEQQLRDGVWVSIAESRTQDGGTVCVHRDISAQRKAEEELMRRAALVQMLREIALETNEADNIPEAIQTCIDKVCAYTGFVIGHAWLPPERDETRELVPARLWYLREPQRYLAFREATEASRFAPGVGLPGRVWVSREPHWIDDLAEDVNFPRREVAVAAGLGSACAFPVLERDRVVAVLEFYSAGVIERDTPLLNAVAHLASQLGRVTERKRAVMALNKLRQAVEQSPAMIMITDRQGAIEYVNPEFSASTGYRPDEAIGRTPALLKSGQMEPEVYRVLWETITSGHDWRGEFLNLRKDGSTYWAATTVSPIRDQGGNVTHFLGIAEDVTERKRSEERIEHLAHFDPLTDLPNRALFQAQSRQILAAARRSGRPVALLMLDLDDFKDVNDSLGHAAGDRLLEQVAGRLKDCLREGDMVARLGGDEFALVLPEVEGPEAVDTAVRRLLEKVAEPYTLDELDLFVNASVGIALYPGDGEDAETLLKHADLALYRAKNRGRGTFNFFKPAMDQEVQQRKSLENDLRSALARGDLHLVYQPQVELENRRMTGVEALVRWHHPERGPISPAQFIPIAERSGLIVQLGEWVLEEACRQARAWRDAGMVELVVAVNLSPVQFKHPDLVGMVERVLRRSGLEAELLNLEITEGVVMQDTAANLKLIEALRAMGIRIALDDFGTGYSSLSYLTSLPVDKIKIDRSFVTALAEDPVRRSIVRSIVELGGALGKRVNVEGVETAEQLAVLVGHSVDEVQGYYFSPPVAAKEIQHMVARPAWQEQLPEQAPRSGATRQAG